MYISMSSKTEEELRAALQKLQLQVSDLESRLVKSQSSASLLHTNSYIISGRSPRQSDHNAAARLQQSARHSIPDVDMSATRVVMTHIVSNAESNFVGTMNLCMGGTILSWVDVAAGLAAKTLARRPCVTASIDSIQFLRPCRVGSVVVLAAMVNRTFATSMEVGVRVEEEDAATGTRHHCCSAYLTFVVADRDRFQGNLPRVVPNTRRQQEIHQDAAERREQRLAVRERLKQDPDLAQQERQCRLLPVTHQAGNTPAPALPPIIGDFGLIAAGAAGGGGHYYKRWVNPSATAAHVTQIIMPQHANSIGVTFGGQVMRWMEMCSFIVASRVCRGGHLLTAGLDSVTFTRPTRVGDTMYVEAQATAVFGSSVEVVISVWGEQPEEGELFYCGGAYATVVKVNLGGEPVDIDCELRLQTKEDELRHHGAADRRGDRLRLRQQLKRRSTRPSLDEDIRGGTGGLGGPGQGRVDETDTLYDAVAE